MSRNGRRRDAAIALLIACVREDEPFDLERASRLLSATTPTDLLAAAAYHGVSGWAYDRLRVLPDASDDLVGELRDRYDDAVRGHLRATWELASLAPILDADAVRWVVIKGMAVVELIYASPGVRPYGDIDVLVEPARFDEVLTRLQEHGSQLLDRNWTVIRRDRLGELHLRLPGGTPLDLHWNVVNMYRGRIRIEAHELLDRAVRANLGGVVAPTLDPTDTMIHLALHATLAGGDRLRWMKDVALAASRRPPDWDALTARAEAWGVGTPVGFMLQRARTVLGAPIPDQIPRRLLPRSYRAVMRLVDAVSPWESARGRLTTPSLLLTRSMGLGLGGAAGWLVSRTLARLDPREPAASSTFTPRGDERDLAAFLADVVITGRR